MASHGKQPIVIAGLANSGANTADICIARLQNDLVFADKFD